MQKGDHLISARVGYSHHGLCINHKQIIHYSGSSLGQGQSGVIEIVSLDEFCQGNGYTIQSYPFRTYSQEESVERAKSRLGEDWYNVLLNNCEHFVTWCIMGIHHSQQVSQMIAAIGLSKATLANPVTVGRMMADRVMIPTVLTSSTAASTAGAGISSVGLVSAGLAAPAIAPLLATAAAGAVLGFGVRKLTDWFFD